jgi:PEP-CTERM motif
MGWFSTLSSAAILSLGLATSANANTYDFSFSGFDVSGSGVLTTVNGGGSSPFAITAVSGAIFDSQIGPGAFTITGLSSYASADNLLYYPTQPYIDFSGISFATKGGGNFNIGNGPPYALVSSILNPGGYFPGGAYTTISLQISQTPLPASWTMMLIGVAGFSFVAYRRKSKPTGLMAT